ncbi:MAG: TIR domain-containing protein [Pseudomonadota bacterium]
MIFLSYAGEDQEMANRLADGLRGDGFTVEFDRDFHTGSLNQLIERKIQEADLVLVLWSKAAKQSNWVLGEASLAQDLDVLLPVRIDGVMAPPRFRDLLTSDLSGWGGDVAHQQYRVLLHRLRQRLELHSDGPPSVVEPVAEARARRIVTIALSCLLLALSAGLLLVWTARSPDVEAEHAEEVPVRSLRLLTERGEEIQSMDVMRSGEQFYLEVMSPLGVWVYVGLVDSQGRHSRLYPTGATGGSNPVGGQLTRIPASSYLRLDGNPGIELLYVFVEDGPRADLEALDEFDAGSKASFTARSAAGVLEDAYRAKGLTMANTDRQSAAAAGKVGDMEGVAFKFAIDHRP